MKEKIRIVERQREKNGTYSILDVKVKEDLKEEIIY